jgi:hypothetical protein
LATAAISLGGAVGRGLPTVRRQKRGGEKGDRRPK